ncbi:MAG: cation transporter [Lachnospiraceae bacterium]|nr:cation transporter [Lachnospiraceae bacterium]
MTKTVINIDGMMCSMCEAHINEAIRKALGVSKVRSSHKKGLTEIISDEPLDEAAAIKAVNDTGYTVTGYKSEPYTKKGIFG